MEVPFERLVNLDEEQRVAYACATEWGVDLEPPFQFSNVSYVAPTTDGSVMKVSWGGDEQALHEGDALELWNGDGAVRLSDDFPIFRAIHPEETVYDCGRPGQSATAWRVRPGIVEDHPSTDRHESVPTGPVELATVL